MAWIEMHQSLPTHRKTLALADALNIEPVYAVGHLACLWMWALDNAPDGNLAGVTARTIARAAQWKRNPEKLVAALTESGFVEDERIHDWPDYAGRLLERRRRDAERKRTERTSPPDVPPPSNGRPKDILTTSGASRAHITVPNPTVPNRTGQDPPTTSAPPAGRSRRVTEADEDFKSELEEQFWQAFGSREAVHDCIDTAMAHKARLKCSDQRAYLRNWVRTDAERRGKRQPPGRPTPITIARASPSSALPQPVQVACEDCGGETYRNDPDSPWCYPCLAARKKATA